MNRMKLYKERKAKHKLQAEYIEKGITFCELQYENCTHNIYLASHHRHKRLWYRKRPHLLWTFEQTLCACTNCHQKIENDKELTAMEFLKNRGPE